MEQLGKIQATLEDPKVIGTTGFHCGKANLTGTDIAVNLTQANMPEKTLTLINIMCESITNLTDQAKDEITRISNEQRQVQVEIMYIEGYVCDCTYYGWTEHSTTKTSCTKPCGNGTFIETRVRKWEKKNSGEECSMADGSRVVACNGFCCRE